MRKNWGQTEIKIWISEKKSKLLNLKEVSDLCHRSAPPSPAHSCTATAADRIRAGSRASARSGRTTHRPTRGHTWRHTETRPSLHIHVYICILYIIYIINIYYTGRLRSLPKQATIGWIYLKFSFGQIIWLFESSLFTPGAHDPTLKHLTVLRCVALCLAFHSQTQRNTMWQKNTSGHHCKDAALVSNKPETSCQGLLSGLLISGWLMDVSPADSGLVTAAVGDVTAAVTSWREEEEDRSETGGQTDGWTSLIQEAVG